MDTLGPLFLKCFGTLVFARFKESINSRRETVGGSSSMIMEDGHGKFLKRHFLT